VDVRTTSCIVLTIPHPFPFVQCFIGLFFTFKTENNSLRASYLEIGWPWFRRWKIIASYTIFFLDEDEHWIVVDLELCQYVYQHRTFFFCMCRLLVVVLIPNNNYIRNNNFFFNYWDVSTNYSTSVIETCPFLQQLNISCISPTVLGNPPPRPILPKNLGKSKTCHRTS
jgi:hypothetical protein